MYDSLKKHGLSDTKHQLKQYLSGSSASRTSEKRTKNKVLKEKTIHISNFDLEDSTHAEQKKNKESKTALELLLEMLLKKQKQNCQVKGHDNNPLKYMCLQQNCLTLGCSYCFLERHANHSRTEIRQSLKQLKLLNHQVAKNRAESVTLLTQKRNQITKRVKEDIDGIKTIFAQKIDQITKRVEDIIDREFQQKMNQITMAASKKAFLGNDLLDFSSKSDLRGKFERMKTDLSVADIVELFNQKDGKKSTKKAQFLKTGKIKGQSELQLYEQEEYELLKRLSKVNSFKLQQFLRHESQEVKQLTEYLKVYQDFYEQMKRALQQFFVTFNLAVPCFTSFEQGLIQPDILSAL